MIKTISQIYSKINQILFRNSVKIFFLAFILITVLICLCDPASARAGGGGGYSSGGGYSGGGFSGNNGSNGGGTLLIFIYFCIHYPYIGIPAVLIFIFFIYHGSKGTKSKYMTRTIRRGYKNQHQNNLDEIIAKIKSKDELFCAEELTERVKNGFTKIQLGWAKQNINSTRHIMSDGVFERFSIQLGIQKNTEIINKMENINILDAQIVAAETDHYFDTLHFIITASASDYYINSKTGKIIYGNTTPETFTEYWSFLRKPGVKTLSKGGLLEDRCPNCGTSLKIGDSVICPTCSAIVNSGEYDWVLTEITQPTEWKIKPCDNIAGIKEMTQKDPAFNIQHIEDKASVIFYRNIASTFYSDKKHIAKLALNEFIEKHKLEYQLDKKGEKSYYADAAIGCVEVVEIIPARETSNLDKIRVKVKWAGHPAKVKIPSLILPAYIENRIYTQEFILIRNSNIKTSNKNTLSSTHCPNCGAPEGINTSNKCEYCGAILNDGSRDWVLSNITFFSGYPQHKSHYESMEREFSNSGSNALAEFDNEAIIGCSVAVMLIDGNISEKENNILQNMAKKRGISQEKLNSITATIQEHGLHIPNPKTKNEALEFLKCMVRMCLADGKITSQEKQLIKQLVIKMDYTDIDIEQMIKKERTQLYKDAKEVNNSI
jgi:uncharacterized Zn finger protein (UPF0148 family)/uncharacterized tellurite resistance protein B-like protein